MCCKDKKAEVIEQLKEEKVYKKPWFWVCITIIVFCITRPHVKIVCGNGCGNCDNGNSKKA